MNLSVANKTLFTSQDEYVVLYDADHHPEANSLQILASRLLRSDCIAMQGSTYIRNTRGSCLARYVDAEFFVTHFIFFPAMEILGDTGYFGGSKCAHTEVRCTRAAKLKSTNP